jgi:glycoside/pentoside/hexuronide:cation symporter, GPH family
MDKDELKDVELDEIGEKVDVDDKIGVSVAEVARDQLKETRGAKRLGIKLAYGCGEAGLYILAAIQGFYLSSFFLEVAQIPASLAGVIVLVAECFDGLIDPVVGKLSDETRTRWGRRRPWIAIAALPLCAALFLQFTVPPLEGMALFAFYLGISVLVKLFFACVAVPYGSLTPEITMDYNQRTSLTMWRMIMGMTGSVGR